MGSWGVGQVCACVHLLLSVYVCVGTSHTRAFDVQIYYKLKYKDEHGPDVYESSARVTQPPFVFALQATVCVAGRWPLASALMPGDAYLAKLIWRTGSSASRVTLRECS